MTGGLKTIFFLLWIGLTGMVSLTLMYMRFDLISVTDQALSESISIDRLILSRPGFILVQKEEDFNNHRELSSSGLSYYYPANVYQDISLDLYDLGASRLEKFSPGERAYLSIYQDNGDKVFDAAQDEPVMRWGRQYRRVIRWR